MQLCLLTMVLLCFTVSTALPRCECPAVPAGCSSLNELNCTPYEKCIVKRDTSDYSPTSSVKEIIDERRCNSETLRAIMLEHMDGNVREVKIAIMRAAEAKIGGHFNVICARGDFSYITTTHLYCLQSLGDVNCYAFLADISRKDSLPEPHQSPTRTQ